AMLTELGKSLVEGAVLTEHLSHVADARRLHGFDDPPQAFGRGLGPSFLHAQRHELLEHDAQARDLFEILGRESRDTSAATRLTRDQLLLGEPGESFANRNVADA